jgi:thiamine pyrophosphokinase
MAMKKVIFIVAGGEIGDSAFFRQQIEEVVPAAIICADSGANHLKAAGRIPDLLVGDLDSVAGETLRYFEKAGCRIVHHPRHKDETDTELAIYESLTLHPTEIWIWGAMGKRLDHTLANLSLLYIGIQKGLLVKLIDPWCEAFMINRQTDIDGKKGQTVSLFPVAGKVTGITLTGFEYPLSESVMEIGHPYGVSNCLANDRGTIEMGSGLLLVVRFFEPGAFPAGEGE